MLLFSIFKFGPTVQIYCELTFFSYTLYRALKVVRETSSLAALTSTEVTILSYFDNRKNNNGCAKN